MVQCNKCKGFGHIARYCPNNTRASAGGMGPAQPHNQGNNQGGNHGYRGNSQAATPRTGGGGPLRASQTSMNALLTAMRTLKIDNDAFVYEPPSAQDKQDKKLLREANREKWAKSGTLHLAKAAEPVTGGETLKVKANFFKVTFLNNLPNLRRYRIGIGPIDGHVPKNRSSRRVLIETILREHNPTPNSAVPRFMTDYCSYIVSIGRLYPNRTETVDHDGAIYYPVPHNRTRREGDTSTDLVQSKLVYEGDVSLGQLKDFVGKSPATDYLPFEDLRSLNLLSWKLINDAGFQGGTTGNKFFPLVGMPTRNSSLYNIKTGFFTSMRPGVGSLLLNVNTATSAFYPVSNLQSWIDTKQKNLGERKGGDLWPRIRTELKGLMVTFKGDVGPRRQGKKRTICEVAPSPDAITTTKFSFNGANRTVHRHMQLEYRLTPSQTTYCVNLGGPQPADKRWYPADYLTFVPLQICRSKLDPDSTSTMLTVAKKYPSENQDYILNQARGHLGIVSGTQFYERFGLKVALDFVSLDARKMDQLSFLYGNNVVVKSKDRYKPASWNLAEACATTGGKGGLFQVYPTRIPEMHIIKMDDCVEYAAVDGFLDLFETELASYGFGKNVKIKNAIPVKSPSEEDATERRMRIADVLDRVLDEINKSAQNSKNASPSIIFFLLPSKDARLYSDIKWWGDCYRGITTMCITGNAMWQAVNGTDKHPGVDKTVLANLCLKINYKLGGTNHKLADSVQRHGLKQNTLVVGADVTHAGKCADPGCPSLAGVVSCVQELNNNYLASARLQSNNTEFIEELKDMMMERLRDCKTRHGIYPSHILFYRDGVSESQYGMVKDAELPQIEAVCKDLGISPKITLLVVGKRHHVRFYPQDQTSTKNPIAGICIDHEVISPRQFSFYLQSHDSPIGTARTGHYVVISNGSEYSAKELQEITNKLCFTGSRATKGLSICTPARYADLLCTRLRCYMKPVLDGVMTKKIYNASVAEYRRQPVLWGSANGNPWTGDALGRIMFYL